jgi:hypothetical protein
MNPLRAPAALSELGKESVQSRQPAGFQATLENFSRGLGRPCHPSALALSSCTASS